MQADAASLVVGAVRLGRILEDAQIIAPSQVDHRVEIGWLPVKVGRQDDLRAPGNGGLDAGRIKIVRARVGLDRNRDRPGQADGKPGRDIAIAADDNLVTLADVHRP